MIRPYDAWTVRRLLCGHSLNGELDAVSDSFRCLADHLASLKTNDRQTAWNGFLCGRADADNLLTALADTDPSGPPPEAESGDRCATLADLRRLVANVGWHWEQWLAAGVLNGLAADPGTGKTLMATDLARRLWFQLPWPDGQDNPFSEGTRTLWVPGDRHYSQLMELAGKYGLPDEAILFNAPEQDPTAGLDLDDPAELEALTRRIEAEAPGLVIVDTVGMTSTRNLCRSEDANAYFGPLMDIAQQTGTAFLLLTHLSKDGEALGRRFNGACRSVWKMTNPDPEGQADRRRVWVDKSFADKPPPLGMTIEDNRCSFDFSPPTAPEPSKGGRPPEAREKARQFILDALRQANDRKARDLCSEWAKTGGNDKTFWRARDELVEVGELVCEGKPKILHLNRTDQDDDRSGLEPDAPAE